MATNQEPIAAVVSNYIVVEVGPKESLRFLYWEMGLSTYELAALVDVAQPTIRYHMDKHGVKTRSQKEANRQAHRVERASHSISTYERWSVRDPDGTTAVGVHELTAIADGADPETVFDPGTHVHHTNSHPIDNRIENLEVVDASQHSRTHQKQSWTYDSGLGCRVLETAERDDGGKADE